MAQELNPGNRLRKLALLSVLLVAPLTIALLLMVVTSVGAKTRPAAEPPPVAPLGQVESTFTSTQPLTLKSPGITLASPTPDPCSLWWHFVPSPNGGDRSNLLGIAAVSSRDVWAVGFQAAPTNLFNTLIEHWNGSTWSIVPSPSRPSLSNFLKAISVVSSNDVWAVGYDTSSHTLIEHWNGASWSIVDSPNYPGTNDYLLGVSAISSNDVWAVGEASDVGGTFPLIEHWNGSAWSTVPSAAGAALGALYAVSAVSSNDVWAVGAYGNGFQALKTLTEHWNGSTWSLVSSETWDGYDNWLMGVSAVSSGDVWAVGYFSIGTAYLTLTEHWNGSKWEIIPSPNGPGTNRLLGVAAISSGDVWAVGDNSYGTLAEHWAGSTWSGFIDPSVDTLSGVTAIGAYDVWAAGSNQAGSNFVTLTEHYTQQTGCPSPTPAPTSTHILPTATPTSCSVFTDVAPGSTFYPYITCMACRGIINGYTSGCETGNPCFRPQNKVTRAQLAKMISNSAGYSEQRSGQTFADVLTGDTFYQYIERLASRQIISGYACGGPGEPCDAQQHSYFRPGAITTRAQIAKIDVLAAVQARGWQLSNPTSSTFEDVAPGSTYYQHIETSYAHQAINGYPCGTLPAGPCVAPGNKPYFVPASETTRGQTSKIVTNTFFPTCQSH